jgi:hypothetical protein
VRRGREPTAAEGIVLVCLALALATAALYAPVRDFDFIRFDDPRYVTQNENLQEGLSTETFVWAATANIKSNWPREGPYGAYLSLSEHLVSAVPKTQLELLPLRLTRYPLARITTHPRAPTINVA